MNIYFYILRKSRLVLLVFIVIPEFLFSQVYISPNSHFNSISTCAFSSEFRLFEQIKPFHQDTLKPLPRLLYSGYAGITSAFAGHVYLYLRTFQTQDWSQKFKWKYVQQTFTMPPKWDHDNWTFNYLVHPYMGSLTYLAYRNRGGNMAGSFLAAALNSAFYEYIIASSLQRPSANDIITTPLTGAVLGESIYQVKRCLFRDKKLTKFERITLLIIDPYEVVRHRFKFEKMIE